MITRKHNVEMGVLLAIILLLLSMLLDLLITPLAILLILIATLFAPVVFTPITFFLIKLGLIFEKIFSSFLLLCVFFLLLTPIALIRRCFSRTDFLQLRSFKKSSKSAFFKRYKVFKPDDLVNQF